MNMESTSISCKSHRETLLEGIKMLRNHELLFDCTLKADGQEVPVHKLVLAACSDYFQSMFCGSMKESKQSSVELHGIKAATLKALVNFAYTGNLELSLENVEDIVSGAQYFQMIEAVELCTRYLKKNLTLETLMNILNIASTYALDPVESATREFMLKNFKNIPGDNLSMLEKEKLFDLVCSNSLIIKSEYTLFEQLMSCKLVLSEDTFHEALRYVRFPLMTSEELSSVGVTEVMSSSRNKYLLEEALEYKKDVIRQPVMQTPRTQVRSDTTSFLFSTENVIFHTSLKKRVVFLKPSKCLKNIEIERIAVVDNFLYVCGNTASHAVFLRYDPRFNVWQELPRLSVAKEWFPLIPHQGQIYAIGGRERSVECYSISENKWKKLAPINYDNGASAGVVYENRIYVSGGSDEYDEDQAHVSCYDPVNDTWESKSQMVEKRQKHLMATINGKIFAFGGEGSSMNCSQSVEYFDPEINQWTLATSELRGPVCALFQCCTDVYVCRIDDIYITSISSSGRSDHISFEKYDAETGQVTNSIRRMVTTKNTNFEDYRCGWTFKCACLTFP